LAAYQIKATPVFKVTLSRLVAFLTRKYSEALAQEVKKEIKSYILERLVDTPFIGAPSDRLLELGIKVYRQLLIGDHNILFYRVDENLKEVYLLAVMDSRQSIDKLLHEVHLLIE